MGEWQGVENWWMNETFFKKWHRFSFLLQFPQWNCLNAISIHHLAPWRDEHIKALFTVVNYEPHSGAGIGGWGWGSVNHKPIPLHLWLYLRYFSVEPLFVPSLWSFQRDIKRQQRVGFTPSGFDFSFHLRRLFHLFLCFVFFWSSRPQRDPLQRLRGCCFTLRGHAPLVRSSKILDLLPLALSSGRHQDTEFGDPLSGAQRRHLESVCRSVYEMQRKGAEFNTGYI